MLPRLSAAGIRYVQVCRGGPREVDGVVVLADTDSPERLVRTGPWTLANELVTAGTVPQVATGRRLCTHKHKGWVLDRAIADITKCGAYRHVIGFNADEERRAEWDGNYTSATRFAEYPLIEWGWGRSKLEAWLEGLLGERWPKSCCGFCPFAACAGGRAEHLARWVEEPERGVEALLIEHTSLALNPHMSLYGSRRAVDLARGEGLDEVVGRFESAVANSEHALYRVRRVWSAKRDRRSGLVDESRKGVGWRSVEVIATGTLDDMVARIGAEAGGIAAEVDDKFHRVWRRRASPDRWPTAEEVLVVAPSGVAEKKRPGFEALWAQTVYHERLF